MKNITRSKILIGFFLITTFVVRSQNVAINTSGNTAVGGTILDLSNNLANGTNAFLAPYVNLTSLTVLAPVTGAGPAGLLVFNTNASLAPDGIGYYFWTGSTGTPANTWVYLYNTGAGPLDWLITGNSNIVDGTNFLGTTNTAPINFQVNGSKAGRIDGIKNNTFIGVLSGDLITSATTGNENAGFGAGALQKVTTNQLNTAIGFNALNNTNDFGNTGVGAQALFSTNGGGQNTGVGLSAGFHNSTGGNNTWIGVQAGEFNVAGNNSTAIGYNAMYNANNQGGSFTNTNVAVGYQALMGSGTPANNTGLDNTAIGYNVLSANAKGGDNTSLGYNTMLGNTYAGQNTIIGSGALQSLNYTNATTAWATDNVAVGFQTLFHDQPTSATTGYRNTTVGDYGLFTNVTGNSNNAMGYYSLYSNTGGSGNVAVGDSSLFTNTTGSYNTALGWKANVGSNNLTNAAAIGYNATVSISNAIILGQTATPTKVGIGTSTPLQLLHVNGTEQLGTAGTTQGDLIFANTTANSVTMNSSNSTTAAYTMILPTAAAAGANYVLASTGANATLQWVNAATTFTTSITANNGAYMSTATNVQFGTNPLIQNTTLPLNAFTLTETANLSGPPAHLVENANASGIALGGMNSAGQGGGTGSGIYGSTAQSGGYGIEGINTYPFSGTGVFGQGTTYGVYGTAATGVYGFGTNIGVAGLASVTGVSGTATTTGVLGTALNGVIGASTGGTNSMGGRFTNNGGAVWSYEAYYDGTSYYGIYSNNLLVSTAGKSTVVEDTKGNTRLMYCSEAPEMLFQDFGTATLVDGKVHIDLDPIYAKNVTINKEHPLKVIITMNDECPNSLYVTNRTATGFDVVEMNHGTSNASFTYEVTANRADDKNGPNGAVRNFSSWRFQPIKVPTQKDVSTENKSK